MDYDTVIIGSGAGGGSAAWALTRAGQRVLVVERGPRPPAPPAHQDEHRMLLLREASYDAPLEANGRRERPLVGSLVGGSTSLYGAVLARPAPADFAPGRDYGERLPRALWDWPIGYDELEPFLEQAEDLYAVAGEDPPPGTALGRRSRPYPASPPPLEPINRRLDRAFRAGGLRPWHLPLGIDFGTCRRCPVCPGYHCPTGARASSAKVALTPALAAGAELWDQTTALRLEHVRGRATHLIARHAGRDGREVRVSADRFLVAASALQSPLLLERSGLGRTSDQLGRNFMFHLGAVAVAVFARPTGGGERYIKQLGFADWYHGAPGFPHKLGLVQAIPLPGPLTLAAKAPLPVPLPLARWLVRRAAAFVLTLEDLPRPTNRVVETDGGPRLEHAFADYDLMRARRGLALLRQALRRARPLHVVGALGDGEVFHLAHQVGTTRFGDDPSTSVLDRDCRVHDADNVYVVDGSFMPTSLGVGPALTIAANALRVAHHLS